MLIGMGGGAASSMATGANAADLDFDSVQRGNAEIERRAQEVIDRCWALGDAQPDPVDPRRRRRRPVERAARAGRTAPAAARASTCARCRSEEPGMSPREIWCNEAQERYVLAIAPERLRRASRRCASASAARSRCVGDATDDGRLRRRRPACSATRRSTCRCDVLLGKPPKMHARRAARARARCAPLDLDRRRRCARPRCRVLRLPTVADKTLPRSRSATAPSAA